ncbi:hypothetical protein NCCP28_35940 [Niallia sp. NCCP-28]|nr:hypothetical protein NCCP28_35940 [Niallia sp. NCCP-28]
MNNLGCHTVVNFINKDSNPQLNELFMKVYILSLCLYRTRGLKLYEFHANIGPKRKAK